VGNLIFFQEKIIKRIKNRQNGSKTYLQTSLIPQFSQFSYKHFNSTIFPSWYPQTLVKKGEGQKSREDGGKKREKFASWLS